MAGQTIVSQAARAASHQDPFTFTEENLKKVQEHLAKYPKDRKASAILPLLDLAQRQCGGWLPQPAIEAVAQILGLPAIKALEVASFYTMFNLKPVGKYHLQVCGTTPCWLRGAQDIKKAIQDYLNLEEGSVTEDGLFSLVEVECLGACVNAPVVQINDDFYEDLSPEDAIKLLKDLAAGKKPTPGSALGRTCSAPHRKGSKNAKG